MLFIQICPSDSVFLYETAIQLHNFKQQGIEHLSRIVVYSPPGRPLHSKWKALEALFPEAHFHYYTGEPWIQQLITSFRYIPLLRIYCWIKFLEEHPEVRDEIIFYHDSDILFPTGVEWLQPFLKDDIIYQSNTASYLSSDYLLSKEKDVLPERLELYKQRDILSEFGATSGITKDTLIAGKQSTGGAQTLLKGKALTKPFWEDVLNSCLNILTLSSTLNNQYFESENKGFQTWALGDMGGLLWTLWKYGLTTATPKEFDFTWATSRIEDLEGSNIYHNAGATQQPMVLEGKQHKLYNKKGHLQVENNTVYESYIHDWDYPLLQNCFTHPQTNISPRFCSHYYWTVVEQCRKLYNL